MTACRANLLNCAAMGFSIAKYCTIFPSLAVYSPENCFTTNCESLSAISSVRFSLFASCGPVMMASYSTSLFVALKRNVSA